MKCRSKPEIARILGKNFDLSSFDFRSGRVLQSAIRKSKRLKGSSYDYARGMSKRRWSPPRDISKKKEREREKKIK